MKKNSNLWVFFLCGFVVQFWVSESWSFATFLPEHLKARGFSSATVKPRTWQTDCPWWAYCREFDAVDIEGRYFHGVIWAPPRLI